jgi:hypothetical protein
MISSYCNDSSAELASAGGSIFFTASDPIHGQELWAYDPGPYYALTAEKYGVGSGTITSAPAGINCGAYCSKWYASGSMVTLTAVPGQGAVFTGWSGCTVDPVNSNQCSVLMNAAKTTTANFAMNVSSQIGITSTGFLYSRVSRLYTGKLTITNNGPNLSGTIDVVLSGLTPGVTLVNATGSHNGAPQIQASTNGLAAGASISIPLRFSDPSNARINFTPVILQE